MILGLWLQRYSTNTKRYPPKKVFGNSEFCSSRQNHSRPNGLENCGFGGKNKTQSFQKLFSGGYFFLFVEYLCDRSPKIKTKTIKNYSSILAIVNHRNWLDDSPPFNLCFGKFWIFCLLFLFFCWEGCCHLISCCNAFLCFCKHLCRLRGGVLRVKIKLTD